MAGTQLRMRWNGHYLSFISGFSSLLITGALADVTLAAEGRYIMAHKVVLSVCSSYFKSLLIAHPCKNPIVMLRDVRFADLKLLVDFMYFGEVFVPEKQREQFLKTAVMFGLNVRPDPKYRSDSVTSTPTSTGRSSEEQSNIEGSSHRITVNKPTPIILQPQHNLIDGPMTGMPQQMPCTFSVPYQQRPLFDTKNPLFPWLSLRAKLDGMSSVGNLIDPNKSHSPQITSGNESTNSDSYQVTTTHNRLQYIYPLSVT